MEFQFVHPYKWGVTRYADRFLYTPGMGPDTFQDDVRQHTEACPDSAGDVLTAS
jgi:hypothetical protein